MCDNYAEEIAWTSKQHPNSHYHYRNLDCAGFNDPWRFGTMNHNIENTSQVPINISEVSLSSINDNTETHTHDSGYTPYSADGSTAISDSSIIETSVQPTFIRRPYTYKKRPGGCLTSETTKHNRVTKTQTSHYHVKHQKHTQRNENHDKTPHIKYMIPNDKRYWYNLGQSGLGDSHSWDDRHNIPATYSCDSPHVHYTYPGNTKRTDIYPKIQSLPHLEDHAAYVDHLRPSCSLPPNKHHGYVNQAQWKYPVHASDEFQSQLQPLSPLVNFQHSRVLSSQDQFHGHVNVLPSQSSPQIDLYHYNGSGRSLQNSLTDGPVKQPSTLLTPNSLCGSPSNKVLKDSQLNELGREINMPYGIYEDRSTTVPSPYIPCVPDTLPDTEGATDSENGDLKFKEKQKKPTTIVEETDKKADSNDTTDTTDEKQPSEVMFEFQDFGMSKLQAKYFRNIFNRQMELLYRAVMEDFNTHFRSSQIGIEFVLEYMQNLSPSNFGLKL